jgi:Ser/Thr protein kinase RdoA (MazF antagonist)
LNVLDRHAGLDPDPARDRNEYVKRMAFDESGGRPRQTVRQLGSPGHALIAHYEELLDRHRAVRLPRGDLVHGDFNTCNVLIHQGRVSGAIDIEELGSGTRVID